MSRLFGTVSRGVRAPIIKQGDDIVKVVTDSVLEASKVEGVKFYDKDVVAMTEAIVAPIELIANVMVKINPLTPRRPL